MLEREFQRKLKAEIINRFPEAIIFKCDPQQRQGTPDLLILCHNKWAALEVKRCKSASHRPNQNFRVEEMNRMSYASFIYPENMNEVLDDLERLFQA